MMRFVCSGLLIFSLGCTAEFFVSGETDSGSGGGSDPSADTSSSGGADPTTQTTTSSGDEAPATTVEPVTTMTTETATTETTTTATTEGPTTEPSSSSTTGPEGCAALEGLAACEEELGCVWFGVMEEGACGIDPCEQEPGGDACNDLLFEACVVEEGCQWEGSPELGNCQNAFCPNCGKFIDMETCDMERGCEWTGRACEETVV